MNEKLLMSMILAAAVCAVDVAAEASLEVRAPYGADVYLDGYRIGRGPGRLDYLRAGTHTVAIVTPDGRQWEVRVSSSRGRRGLRVVTLPPEAYRRERGRGRGDRRGRQASRGAGTAAERTVRWTAGGVRREGRIRQGGPGPGIAVGALLLAIMLSR